MQGAILVVEHESWLLLNKFYHGLQMLQQKLLNRASKLFKTGALLSNKRANQDRGCLVSNVPTNPTRDCSIG
jgi:hypothetical protein